jgi:hypothetical protein
VLGALLCSRWYVTQSVMHEGPVKRIFLWVDEIMILILLLYFVWGLLSELFRRPLQRCRRLGSLHV